MNAMQNFETDVIQTSAGDVAIVFLGHGSLMLEFNNLNIYVDPFGKVADYSELPEADIILLTHEHQDHLDLSAIEHIRTDSTTIIMTENCRDKMAGEFVLHNGEECTVKGIRVSAIPAYNILHQRQNGEPFHPKGIGNGYILAFGDKKIYVAGDTENTPEMKALRDIDVAFLPMNLPYTMTPEMVADAARAFRPRILYPYHYGQTDPSLLTELLREEKDIEVRIRKMA
jgi:L-ascorbate metabolism protein UlaG (beta-lactamase superfamily)